MSPRVDRTLRRPVVVVRSCYCPDDCNCRKPWRTNWCGCKGHVR